MYSLVLIPTLLERNLVAAAWHKISGSPLEAELARQPFSVELCGFGLVAAGIQTAMLLQRRRVERVILLGIAGSYDPLLPIGSAHFFSKVICHGIGVGCSFAQNHRSAAELGWAQCEKSDLGDAIGDTIEMFDSTATTPKPGAALLSVTTASATLDEAAHRQARFPEVVAEDMEAFAVAMACQRAGVPLQVIRGISNRAGDREKANWQIQAALEAATKLCLDQGDLCG